MTDNGHILLHRDVPFGRIEFEHHTTGAREYRAYHLRDLDGRRRRMVSVTSFLGILHKQALLRWYEETGMRNAIAAERAGTLADIGLDQVVDYLRKNEMGAEHAAKIAAHRGTSVHAALETYFRDGTVPNPARYPPDARPYIRHAVRWLLDAERRGLEVEDVERLVAHPGYDYAGRMDLRARLGGLPYVIDWKTNRHGRVWDEQHLQPIAYAVADEKCGAEPVHGCLIVAIGPNGYEEMRSCAEPADFQAILDVYRRLGKLRNAVKAERHRLEAVAA